MDAMLDHQPQIEFSSASLQAARERIAELETELRHLQAARASADTAPFGASLTQMRLSEVEAWLVRRAMDRARGNISRAARALGISRAALYRRLARHGVDRAN